MNAYEFDISRATKSADLQHMAAEIVADETLFAEEKDELLQKIASRLKDQGRVKKEEGRMGQGKDIAKGKSQIANRKS
jgi:hypothetical protein